MNKKPKTGSELSPLQLRAASPGLKAQVNYTAIRSEVKIQDRGKRPLKAIRAKCLECAGGRHAVRNCRNGDCALYALRFGKNPNRRGLGRVGNIYMPNRSVGGTFQEKTGTSGAPGKGFSVIGAKG